MKRSVAHNFWMRMSILGCLAGILYSSWPLGYIFNPSVARSALASALEAQHQPYNWLFVGGDVSSSLLMIVICWLLWQHYRNSKQQFFLGLVLVNVIIFAFGTIADALLPERCLPGAVNCPAWQHSPLLVAHGVFSILASFCLFLALLFIWWRNRTPLLTALMAGYIIFGLLSLYEAIGTTQGNFSQHYYITLCSLGMALIPYGVYLAFFDEFPEEFWKKSNPLRSVGKKPLG
jgi:hypothetical protein